MENFGRVYPMFAMVVLTCVVLAAQLRWREGRVPGG